MLPVDAVRTITVWPRWVREDGLVKPMRRVLRACSWEERSIATVIQTGNILKEPAVIRVFTETCGLVYVPPHEWLELPEDSLDQY